MSDKSSMAIPHEEGDWTRDVDERRNRRPKQVIDYENGYSVTLTPAWRFACEQCGHERRLASEDPNGWERCPDCEEVTLYHALGRLEYP